MIFQLIKENRALLHNKQVKQLHTYLAKENSYELKHIYKTYVHIFSFDKTEKKERDKLKTSSGML